MAQQEADEASTDPLLLGDLHRALERTAGRKAVLVNCYRIDNDLPTARDARSPPVGKPTGIVAEKRPPVGVPKRAMALAETFCEETDFENPPESWDVLERKYAVVANYAVEENRNE